MLFVVSIFFFYRFTQHTHREKPQRRDFQRLSMRTSLTSANADGAAPVASPSPDSSPTTPLEAVDVAPLPAADVAALPRNQTGASSLASQAEPACPEVDAVSSSPQPTGSVSDPASQAARDASPLPTPSSPLASPLPTVLEEEATAPGFTSIVQEFTQVASSQPKAPSTRLRQAPAAPKAAPTAPERLTLSTLRQNIQQDFWSRHGQRIFNAVLALVAIILAVVILRKLHVVSVVRWMFFS